MRLVGFSHEWATMSLGTSTVSRSEYSFSPCREVSRLSGRANPTQVRTSLEVTNVSTAWGASSGMGLK
jgi:hypothetical protein